MTKLNTLKKLLEIVENKELASGSYYSCGDTCVVGHILLIGGTTEDELHEIQNENLYEDWYSIDSIIKHLNQNSVEKDLVSPALTTCGFNLQSDDDINFLSELQVMNDGKGKYAVAVFLKETIEKMEENQNV